MGNSCCSKTVQKPSSKREKDTNNTDTKDYSCQEKHNQSSLRRQIKNRIAAIDNRTSYTEDDNETRNATITGQKAQARDLRLIKQAIVNNFVFAHIQEETLEILISEMQNFVIEKGRELFKQNDSANYFFVLTSGCLEVVIDGKRKNLIQIGTGFGELALIHNTQRTATIKALERSVLWGLGRSTFRAALEHLNRSYYAENWNFIDSVPLFHFLTQQEKDQLVVSLISHSYTSGQTIVNEGDPGELFYLIQEGMVQCSQKGKELRTLSKGDYFGEQALVQNSIRTATVKAIGSAKLLSISRDTLTKILGDNLQPVLYRNSIKIAFQNSYYLHKLNKEQIDSLACAMCEKINSYSDGDVVFDRDYDTRDHLFIVLKGQLIGDEVFEVFQFPFEYQFIRRQSIEIEQEYVAKGNTDLAWISRSYFQTLIGGSYSTVVASNTAIQVFKQVRLFKNLPALRLDSLIQQLTYKNYQKDDVIVQQGSTGDEFFIVRRGSVNVYQNDTLLRTINKNDYFGERALMFNEQRTATVIANGKVRCWVLNKANFLQLLDQDKYNQLMKRIGFQDDRVELDDLVIVDALGKGQFGHVFLAAHKSKDLLYALKTVNRSKVLQYDISENLLLERRIMLQLDHPFIVKLVKTFKDQSRVYFLMEFIQGQDLFEVLRKIGLLDIQQSKFYAACIILILEHLHERNILYRDLKPENIMVDEDGYLRLIDFGVSKVVTDRTFTTTGTPHYMAPEIIQNKGYNTSVDYWGLGILLYEFIAGDVPFAANKNDPIEVYKAILNGELNYPTIVNANHKAKSLIEQLLNKNPALRGNAATLKKHNLFENFDWEALLDKRVSPPYRQKLPRFDQKVKQAKQRNHNLQNIIRNEEAADSDGSYTSRRVLSDDWDKEF